MGNSCSGLPPDCEIIVKTGDVKGAGTDANVFSALYNEDGTRSRDLNLDCKWKNDFEKGSVDRFKVHCGLPPGRLHKIEIWRDDSGIGDDWYVEWIKVKNLHPGSDEVIFPCNRWVKAERKLVLTEYDCVLPQFDECKEQRKKELEDKRDVYRLSRKAPGIPKQVSGTVSINVAVEICFILLYSVSPQEWRLFIAGLQFRGKFWGIYNRHYATDLKHLQTISQITKVM